jgi:hypothetical protein
MSSVVASTETGIVAYDVVQAHPEPSADVWTIQNPR